MTPRITKYRQRGLKHTDKKTVGGNAFSCADFTAIPCSPPGMCSWKLWWSAIGWVMNQFSCETEFLVISLFFSSYEEDDKSPGRYSKKVPGTRGSSVTQMRQLRSFRTATLKAVLERQCLLQLTVLVQLFMALWFWCHKYLPSTFNVCIKSPQSVLYFS